MSGSDHSNRQAEGASSPDHGYGPCKKCFHGVRSHSPRSGLCGVAGCKCEVFDGPGVQPWEVEDPIDYEHGVRALKNAETIEEAHEPYAHPVLGGWGGYQAACHTCSWRGRVRHTKAEAWDDALPHGPEMKFQVEARESISEYAARASTERDVLREAARLLISDYMAGAPLDAAVRRLEDAAGFSQQGESA